MDEMSRFYEEYMEPAIAEAMSVDPEWPWVSYNMVESPRGGRVIQVIASDMSYHGWASFKETIYTKFKDAPLPFKIAVHYGYFRFL